MVSLVRENGRSKLITEGKFILLPGGFGTELGKKTGHESWATCPAIDHAAESQAVHREYFEAGTEIAIADTFSLNRQHTGLTPELRREYAAAALNNAKLAARGFEGKLVAASYAPVGDCYTPEDTPSDEALRKIHSANVKIYADSDDCDLLFIETMPTLREAAIAAEEAEKAGIPYVVVWTVRPDGKLRDGTPIDEAAYTVLNNSSYCVGIGTNCCTFEGSEIASRGIRTTLENNKSTLPQVPIVAYANGFVKTPEENARLEAAAKEAGESFSPEVYSEEVFAQRGGVLVRDFGVTAIGGCCQTTPAHIKRLRAEFNLEENGDGLTVPAGLAGGQGGPVGTGLHI